MLQRPYVLIETPVAPLAAINVLEVPTQATDCVPLLHFLGGLNLTECHTRKENESGHEFCRRVHPFHSSIIFTKSLNK